MDELEAEEYSRGPLPNSGLVGAPHPSIVPDSHFGVLSTAETFENYYRRDFKYDPKLPITGYRDDIIAGIESNSVVVIQGSTGSGKTTQVPQYILDRAHERREHCNIVVTQPRRIAALSVAQRICSERNWEVGGLVGYQIAMNRMVSEDTRLTFCTTGVLLEKLIQNKNMTQYTHIILDEVHERDDEIDLAMLVVRKMLRTNSKHVKVILMSATIAAETFSDYFASEIQGVLQNAPVITVEGRMYPVRVHYLENYKWLMTQFQFGDVNFDEPAMSQYTTRMCCELIRLFSTMEADQQMDGHSRGTVLAFLPGMGEINEMMGQLEEYVQAEKLHLVPLHSKVNMEDQKKAFHPPEHGFRKVILATNIAESSITVPDVCYVIDFCLVKHLMLDDITNYSALRMCWASRASLLQRQGRAGRVQSGHCFRLIPEEAMSNMIPEYSTPEIQRQSLEQVILRVKTLDMGDPQSLLGQALSPPNRERIAQTVLNLKEVGALSLFTPGLPNIYDGELTFPGKVMASLPVDVRVARLLLLGHVFGYLNECLVMGAVLSLRSVFTLGFREEKLQSFKNKVMWANGSQSDSFASLYAYMEWKLRKESQNFRGGRKGQNQWGRHHSVHIQRMNEVDQLVRDLRDRLQRFNIIADRSLADKARHGLTPKDQLILKTILAGAFYPFYFYSTRAEDADAAKRHSGHDQLTTVGVMGMPMSASLYEKEVKDLFKECGKVKKIHFESQSTKAFVEFERGQEDSRFMTSSGMESGMLLSVMLALKMRQIKYPLFFDKDPKRESISVFSLGPHEALANSTSTGAFGGQQKEKLPQIDLSYTSHAEVLITETLSPSHFWVQMTEYSADLDRMMEEIAQNSQRYRPIRHPQPGTVCIALWSEDMSYYRACVESIQDHDNTAEVLFLDYGNRARTLLCELKECPPELMQVKQQAIECALIGVQPAVLEGGGATQWSRRSYQLFSDLTANKRLWAQVFSIVDGLVRCDLIDTSDPTRDVSVASTLVSHNVGEPCKESLPSQREHEAMVQRIATGRPPAYSASDFSTPRAPAAEASAADGAWQSGFAGVDMDSLDSQYEEVQLKGPYNSYELEFYSSTKSSFKARFERDSVNSVAVDETQTVSFRRFAVAAHVGLAPSGGHMVVRESTLMPRLKGLPALLSMIFAPTLEMRVSEDGGRYTGCICGSGPNPTTKEAVFPDHDMEIEFDVEIDQEDLVNINAIRRGLNIALMDDGSSSKVKWAGGPINRLQSVQQEKIMRLIQRDRTIIPDPPVLSNNSRHRWNLVHGDRVLSSEELDPGANQSGPLPFLNMHSGVRLDESAAGGTHELKQLQSLVQQLYTVASRSEIPLEKAAMCPLCKIDLRTPRELLHHLNSLAHREEEKKVFS